jgi:hypothetical protein
MRATVGRNVRPSMVFTLAPARGQGVPATERVS